MFDDLDRDASTLDEMRTIVKFDARYQSRIRPYLGGEEILRDPKHSCRRYVIDLNDCTEEEARNWPALMTIVETKVRPERNKLKDTVDGVRYKKGWWKWGRNSVSLNEAKGQLKKVIVHPFTSTHSAFAFIDANIVVGAPHIVIAIDSLSAFASLQSRPHENWAWFFASSMKDDLRYTPSDCFETFPFPKNWKTHADLEAVGKSYYEFRAAHMIKNNEGLTKTYNRFHDPDERDSHILKLRELHAAMDRAVLNAYGWHDIPTDCEFLLEYEIDEEAGDDKKKPWRYRWPDKVHDDVLARLLELNSERAKEEARTGAAGARKRGKKADAKRISKTPDTEDLFS
jgi:hypothetical protein